MKKPTKPCVLCGKPARPKQNTCYRCVGMTQLLLEDKPATPRVLASPHFETIGSEDVWPKGRLFFRAEFEEGISEGTWPAGMKVKDEKGRRFEVCLQLRRLRP